MRERVHIERVGSENAPTTIFVHGTPSDSRVWRRLLEYMPDSESAVLVDAPDCGLSDDDPTSRLDDWIDVIGKMATACFERCSEVSLVGHSGGAFVAAHALKRAAVPIRRAVLIAGFDHLPSDAIAMRLDLAARLEDGSLTRDALRAAVLPLMLGAKAAAEDEAIVSATMVDIPIERIRRALLRFSDVDKPVWAISSFDVETTLVHAEFDQAVPIELGRGMEQRGRNARLVALPTDSHFLPLTHARLLAPIVWPSIDESRSVA